MLFSSVLLTENVGWQCSVKKKVVDVQTSVLLSDPTWVSMLWHHPEKADTSRSKANKGWYYKICKEEGTIYCSQPFSKFYRMKWNLVELGLRPLQDIYSNYINFIGLVSMNLNEVFVCRAVFIKWSRMNNKEIIPMHEELRKNRSAGNRLFYQVGVVVRHLRATRKCAWILYIYRNSNYLDAIKY